MGFDLYVRSSVKIMTKIIDSLARGMRVLDELHKRRSSSLADLHRATDINKATLLRILKTLESAGWVNRADTGSHFELSFTRESPRRDLTRFASIQETAPDIFQKLLAAHQLSVVVSARHELQMSTLWSAPQASGKPDGQCSRSMLFSAAGQCYLAFCTEEERNALVQELGAAGGRESLVLARDRLWLKQMIEATRKRGYALYGVSSLQLGGYNREAEELAVPIVKDGDLVACMAVSFLDDQLRRTPMQPQHIYSIVQRAAGDIASRVSV